MPKDSVPPVADQPAPPPGDHPDGHRLSDIPNAFDALDEITAMFVRDTPAIFLDFDGTLSEIVDDPATARLVDGAAVALQRLASVAPLAVVSGRDLEDVQQRVGIRDIWYAGSHGFELCDPDGGRHEIDGARDILGDLARASDELERRLEGYSGATVERKGFATAVHYRHVPAGEVDGLLALVGDVGQAHDRLRVSGGRAVVELRPDLDWDKGKAVHWLLDTLVGTRDAQAIFVGDDLTDEDALRAVAPTGLGIIVRNVEHGDRRSAAHVAVADPDELCRLLVRMADAAGA